ncbi:hypothetical protein QJS04_geneDACA024278 [Acorus gramineus]|uniref:Uncharacterized protein n=1 Tax=Acorus gramineus TaxID=55184 RepID=A0AAV9AK63_ACOGR|nr:hypothetical protein QJS04_geneDACA024278 [Acorus gramineus]
MMMEKCMRFISSIPQDRNGGKSKKGDGVFQASSLVSSKESSSERRNKNTKPVAVMIVLAGGMVELYPEVITAAHVMEKYPGLVVTKPEVFKRPHESIVGSEEVLFPGQKFYLVPSTTVAKLRKKVSLKITSLKEATKAAVEENCEDVEVCSAKDFYVSKERWQKYMRNRGVAIGAETEKKKKIKEKPFTLPIKKPRIKGLRWQPSLRSVEEISP